MLVLERDPGDSVVLIHEETGHRIVICYHRCRGSKIKLTFDDPLKRYRILRTELEERATP